MERSNLDFDCIMFIIWQNMNAKDVFDDRTATSVGFKDRLLIFNQALSEVGKNSKKSYVKKSIQNDKQCVAREQFLAIRSKYQIKN